MCLAIPAKVMGINKETAKVDFGEGKIFLIRAIVDDTIIPATVVTVYRTSKIAKYWRTG